MALALARAMAERIRKRLCLGCGRPTASSSGRCEECVPSSGSKGRSGRDRREQQKFRDALMYRAQGRCEWIDKWPPFDRCSETTELEAHHTQPGNNDPGTGLLLCRAHHRQVDRYAR